MIKYKEINLKAKTKLIISKELQSQIMYLHNKVGDIEWSGILFHSVVSGNINDPENLVLKAEKIYLQDIGVSTYTDFEVNEKIIDFYDQYPEAMSWKMSLIHTHHNMQAFFSGTDTKELHDNAGKYNYYLSLIVNHASKFCAKIAVAAKYNIEKANYTFKGFDGIETIESSGSQQDVLMLIDCDIEFEQSEFDVKQYELIKKTKEEAAKTLVANRTYDFSKTFNNTYSWPTNNRYYQHSLFNEVDTITSKYDLSELDVRKFLCKLLTLDVSTDLILTDVLAEVNKLAPDEFKILVNDVELNLEYFIDEVFPGLPSGAKTDELLLMCIDTLSKYKAFSIVDDFIGIFTIYLSAEPLKVKPKPVKAKKRR